MNITELFKKYDFHDSYIEYFEYDMFNRAVKCCFVLCDHNPISKCEIDFINVGMFYIKADNSVFTENELRSSTVSSADGEYFKCYLDEGFGKPGKVIEIECEYIRYSLI